MSERQRANQDCSALVPHAGPQRSGASGMSIDVAHRAGDAGSAAEPAAGQVRLPGVGTATSPVSYSQTELLDLLRVDDPQIRSVFLNSAINRRFLSLPPVRSDRRPPAQSQGDL